MPGNEVGDRIHNFFGQESLIQRQHQAQAIDGTWHGVTNNPWAANQRQMGTSFISNLKSPSVQQAADYERGHGSQSSGMHQAVNLPPSNLRPDLARSQPQGQQPTLNGYMQGHQVFQSRLNEAIPGVDAESDQRHTTSKGFTGFETELGNGAELHNKSFGRMDFSESPVNFDLLRGQQLTSQNPGMLHSLARQQSGISDMQFLQQQLMIKQIQELQRQQQLQKQQVEQQEARQLSSVTQVSNFVKQAGEAHSSSLINGIPVNDAANYSWQPELVAASTNWTQRGLSPVMQGSFRGNVFSSEPGQVPHLLTMAPQHVDQSLYGVPVSGARATSSEYSPIQMDKLQQMSGNSNSFQGNQYTAFQNQVNLQGGSLVSGQGDQGRNITGATDAQALHSGFDLESLQHVNAQQRNEPAQEFHDRQELAGPLGASQEKTALEIVPSQNVATLDPTEEKILFGSDDNLWDAFSKGANISSGGFNALDVTDVFGAFPSIQSGSWSALMQSAVAETSSSDMGVQEEWTGLTISNSECPGETQQMLSGNESGKQQPTWASNRLQSQSNMKSHGSMNFNNVLEVQQAAGKKSHERSEMPQTGTHRLSQQFQVDGNRFLDSSIQRKEVPEGSNVDGKIPYFSDAEANVMLEAEGNSPRFGSTNDHSSEMLEAETSDGSVHLQQNQSSASRGIGLQLTSPSQQLAADHSFLNQKPTQTTNVLSSSHLTSTTGEKGHAWFAPTSSLQSSPFSHEMSQGHSRNNSSSVGQTGKSVQGNLSAAFPSSFPYSRNLSNQHVADTGIQAEASQSANASFDGFATHLRQMNEGLRSAQTNQSLPDATRNRLHSDNASSVGMSQNYSKGPAQQFPVLEAAPAQPFTASGIAQEDASKLSRTIGTGISSQQRSFGSQPFKALSNMCRTNLPPNNNSETTSRPQKVEDQHAQSGGSGASESGACSENSYGFFGKDQLAKGDSLQPISAEKAFPELTNCAAHGKESVSGHFSGGSLEKDIEAFGRSLRSNNILHQNYSLSHQVQGMKSTELDPTSRSLKRFRGPDSAVDAQAGATQGGQELFEQNIMVRDLSTNRTSIPPGESKMLSFSAPDNQETNAPLHDLVGSGQSVSQSFTGNSTAISARGQHPQICPQMAPSWFDPHGTFKNGQILPAFEARQSATIKTPELPFPIGKSSDKMHVERSIQHGNLVSADGFQNILTSTPTSLASENLPGPQLAGPDPSNVNLVAARMKKRKSAMSDLVPLHKEVMQGPQRPQNMSTAEVDWARATNRLTEKVEDEAELVDDGPPVFRSKRRLICSTQLMQLLLRPPAASVLSDDAITHCETAAYFVARSTLGDTCNKASGAGSGVSVPSSTGNIHPEELKASGKISDQYFSKVMEDLISRGRKLESEILRLDNRASVLDLRLECQDLEKFSVINRFARFHGRGQAEVVETSSSSDSPAASQKFPQRYVTALPMPRNLPERVQCFSLWSLVN
ncbi:hypothetical protein Tsubulata_009062 [Turnera subulata]|uniref:Uncharacterized protein n=1 Tax=Turnera subulata TaxID=218843 RepID=A0A9Q0JH08_9ROSI|nr:hypothetical protein Tsubulata_009062 [Turnera subulata]